MKKRKRKRRKAKHWYQDYLRGPHWANRKRAFLRKYPRCFICGRMETRQVHHKTYKHLGREPDEDLATLCKQHHKLLHKNNLPLDVGHFLIRDCRDSHKPVPQMQKLARRSRKKKKKRAGGYYINPALLREKSGDELNKFIDQLKLEGKVKY